MNNCRSRCGHVLQPTVTILELSRAVIRTNLRTKFHEDWTINMTSRVLTMKIATHPGGHVFQRTGAIFNFSLANIRTNIDYNCDSYIKTAQPIGVIIETNVMTKFREDWTINVTSRKNCPGPYNIGTNVLTNIDEDWAINVTSRVLTIFFFNLAFFEFDTDTLEINLLIRQ
ncbi:hypothetical protein DPMN_058530 [Dreissena polymorpha]|uniref:Uncharacterized protein n=1 Tax=Dreissena polymorpha TaxID=45954 RepID=A0A9D4HDT6_DREPO|nr:hypothetical protein DPMN_058530 [Dreissena polymorpha]